MSFTIVRGWQLSQECVLILITSKRTVKTQSFALSGPLSEDFCFQGFFSVGTLSYVWGKLYRRSFLEKNQITFTDITYAEDKLFNMQCYVCEPDSDPSEDNSQYCSFLKERR